MMFALVEAEADICDGCGGFLSFTTLRDHNLNIGRIECQHCAAIHRQSMAWEKENEATKGTDAEWFPSAQKIRTRPVPLDPEHHENAKMQGLLGPREED